jgi:hypothetical protein
VLNPIRETVLALEAHSASLADCFFGLTRLGAAIKKIPPSVNVSFYNHCITKMNSRFQEFDDDKYILSFFLHPLFRGKYLIYAMMFLTNYLLI